MSLHDPSAPRKPSRLWLYLPFALLLVATAIWSAFWVWARTEAQGRMDAAAADLAKAGYQISWGRRSLGGYPFRLDVTLADAVVRDPSGWALQAPLLEGEAYLYAPTSWILAAPQGLTFVRPLGGPVTVRAKNLRASLRQLDAKPPSFSFEAVEPSFAPSAGAQPFALQSAARVEFHLRSGPDDEGGVFLRVDNGRARPGALLGRIAGDKAVQLAWNSVLSKMSAFSGRDWPDAVARWTDAGGAVIVRPGSQLVAGDAQAVVRTGRLGVGRDGRLRGVLETDLRQAPMALEALAAAGAVPKEAAEAAGAVAAARQSGEAARAAVSFEAGRTTLGPVSLGPAPRVYAPR